MQSTTQSKDEQISSASNPLGSQIESKKETDKEMKDAVEDLNNFQNLSLGPTTEASGEVGQPKLSSIEDTTNLGQILDSDKDVKTDEGQIT